MTENSTDLAQSILRLKLLQNQYHSEISKKELALEGYAILNKYEYLYCPNCLKPIERITDSDTCCLCGEATSDDGEEIAINRREITVLKRKASELNKYISEEEKKYEAIISELGQVKRNLREEESELNHISKGYINPYLEQIETINYEIGKKSRLLSEMYQYLKMLEEVERYNHIIETKEANVEQIKQSIKEINENATDKQQLVNRLSKTFEDILAAFKYPKLSTPYIDEKKYLPYVRDRKYDDIGSLAGVSLITMAYFLTILLEGSGDHYHHLGILMIDSPRKNLGAQAAVNEQDEFKDEVIFNSIIRYLISISYANDSIQLIVVNNGYPDFLPKDVIVAEFDSDGHNGLSRGLIDDI